MLLMIDNYYWHLPTFAAIRKIPCKPLYIWVSAS